MLLASQYGMSAETLASRLGVSTFEAHEMLNQHREQFSQYWRWSDDWVQHALQGGFMRTAFGWTCRTGITEFNERSIRNWPIQSAGADILRIACILAARHGIRLLAPIHDAVLIESSIEQIEADVGLMREIMRRASRVVLNATAEGTHELRTDYTIVRYPDRYSDKRGAAIWQRVMQLWRTSKERRPNGRLGQTTAGRARGGRADQAPKDRAVCRGPAQTGGRCLYRDQLHKGDRLVVA
jgi:DNA polymerase-1